VAKKPATLDVYTTFFACQLDSQVFSG